MNRTVDEVVFQAQSAVLDSSVMVKDLVNGTKFLAELQNAGQVWLTNFKFPIYILDINLTYQTEQNTYNSFKMLCLKLLDHFGKCKTKYFFLFKKSLLNSSLSFTIF